MIATNMKKVFFFKYLIEFINFLKQQAKDCNKHFSFEINFSNHTNTNKQ